MKESYILVFLSFILVIIGRIIFGFFNKGGLEYVKIKECSKLRAACCLPTVKQDVSALNERTKKEDEAIQNIFLELKDLHAAIQAVYLEILKKE